MSISDDIAQLNQSLEAAANSGHLPLATSSEDIVPGEGSPDAHILLIGEAPGHHEQVQRRPFVGRSGQLLRNTLTEVGYPPGDVYISNIVKARPPENRDPTPAEIEAYRPFLNQEIKILDPKIIITLGRFSMAKFLPEVKVSHVHGRLHRVTWEGQPLYVLPMYHPAAGLRSGTVKSAFIADFQKLPKIMQWLSEQEESEELKQQVEEILF